MVDWTTVSVDWETVSVGWLAASVTVSVGRVCAIGEWGKYSISEGLNWKEDLSLGGDVVIFVGELGADNTSNGNLLAADTKSLIIWIYF